MSRFVSCFVACLAGCSPAERPAFHADPSEVTGATIKSLLPPAEDGEAMRPLELSPADARRVYAALKDEEPNEIQDGAFAWAAGYVITFRTRGSDEIGAYLHFRLELWKPARDARGGDRWMPVTAKTILSRYVAEAES